MEPPRIENYPDRSYLIDHAAQLQLNELSRRWIRFLWIWIATAIVCFAVAVVVRLVKGSAVEGRTVTEIMFWVWLAWFIAPLHLVWPTRRPHCSTCGQKMTREFVNLGRGGGDEHEFMACHACKRYADTHIDHGG